MQYTVNGYYYLLDIEICLLLLDSLKKVPQYAEGLNTHLTPIKPLQQQQHQPPSLNKFPLIASVSL